MIDFVKIPDEKIRILKRDKSLLKKLEELSSAKVSFEEDVKIECDDPIKVLSVKSVIKAFGRGFEFEDALYLLDDSYEICIMDVKDYAKSSKRMEQIKGRVIGREGKTKNIIEKLADVKISIYGKTVAIIGKSANVQYVNQAICMLLEGRKHGGVYKFLEENIKKMKY